MENLIKFAEATGNDLYDPEQGGQWLVENVQTADTIENFIEASKNWAEATVCRMGEIDGLPFVCWARMQAKNGDSRQALSVIDLGDIRISLPGTDLTDYQ